MYKEPQIDAAKHKKNKNIAYRKWYTNCRGQYLTATLTSRPCSVQRFLKCEHCTLCTVPALCIVHKKKQDVHKDCYASDSRFIYFT